jgi:tetratricopeptide (TPR) repeat protein
MKPCRGRAACVLVALAASLSAFSGASAQNIPVADGTPEIDASISSRQWEDALTRLDARLAAQPRDAQAQFKRANVLARLGRDDDAIAAYTALSIQYPELPEPYNNLAALYAKHGQFENARGVLETATRANPGYAQAWQNLGTLYLNLAASAYQRATSLDARDAVSRERRRQVGALLAQHAPAAAVRARPAADAPGVADESPRSPVPSFAPGTVGAPIGVPVLPTGTAPQH